MSTSAERTYEQQNDDALENLYSKVKSLRSVTVDIHDDSARQRGSISETSNQFDVFGDQLRNTSSRFTRTLAIGARQHRTTLYIIAAVVGIFLVWHWFF